MDRRDFLLATSAGLAASGGHFATAAEPKPLRVGLIGCGWYGKSDLFRLLQVNPAEVVSLCDVDSKMLVDAAEMTAQRQASKKKPRTYGDYREMLKEKDLDVVMVETPDHWHALPMIAACEAGADVWVQKPVSVDVAEGKAMLDAARKHNRVVQVVTQRRSTPHLVEAKKEFVDSGRLGTIGLVEIYCYYHMRTRENPPDTAPPPNLDYPMWTGPAPMRPYNKLVHPRSWRAFTEYGNGIIGDMCIHMFDMARWMLDLGWPTRVSSSGGIFIDKKSKANITDTQTATFEYPAFDIVWQHRTYGPAADPQYPWGATFYGDKGTLKASVMGYDFIPQGGKAVHKDVTYELDKYPEDKTEKDLEKHVAPAVRAHWLDFLKARENRGKPVADIEQGYISSASCILANMSQQLGRTLAWDAEKHQIIGDDEANKRLKRPYRQPWVHPAG
ncbi:Gfo/Idh/MocA family protein [Limnoglobus roseus]|uniref:Putative Rossmann-fold-type glycoside hydrolase n=1 Tax=Limnoglobus roseus TaxID=2598579 RepID=A0A5C1ALP6_9BACT|nr:Gfo/Idh/MocA family oxidoreductase [Limnoglobus roseus]QEL20141.1 putative Rossmann-fold-type glycoside hydrolase [Limnoglobus roseus]